MPRSALVALPLLLVPALGAAQGGYLPDAWVWAGAIAAWGAAFTLAVSTSTGATGPARSWLLAGVALTAWTAQSALWSAVPAQSLLDARRTAVYAAFALALAALARGRSTMAIVVATHLVVSALVVYALARYLLLPRRYDPFEAYLLSSPLGYANAVGVLAALAIVAALATVAGDAPGRRRAAVAATIPPLALALELTGSDASVLALGVGILVVLALHARPVELALAAAAQAPPALLAAGCGWYSRLSEPVQPRLGGAAVALVCVACAGLAAAASHGRIRSARRIRSPRALAAVAVAVVAAGALAVALAGSTQPRSSYYRVAWNEYRAHPLLGSGAGTFGRYWLEHGDVATYSGALDAHSLYLETLAELGPVGLVLLLWFLVAPLRRAVAARAEPAMPFAAGAAVAFLVHAGLDWDWEVPAVTLTGIALLAAVGLPPAESAAAHRRAVRLTAIAVALALGAVSIAGVRSRTEPAAAKTGGAPSAGAPLQTAGGEPARLVVAVPVSLVAGVAVPLVVRRARRRLAVRARVRGVVMAVPPRRLAAGAGPEVVAVPQMRLHGGRGDGDRVGGVLLRAGDVADRHAVLVLRPARVLVL